MICPKCGSEIEDGWEGACDCANKKCIYTYKKGGTSYASIGEEWQARAEKAEGELLELKERLGVGDCDYCYSNRIAEMDKTKSEEKALSEKLVKENQELGIKLAKAESELKAIKARIEAVKPDLEEIYYELDKHSYDDWTLSVLDITEKIIKQIGGEK